MMANKTEVRNYSTTISAAKTVGEIQALLAANGASRIMTEYDAGADPTAVSFILTIGNLEHAFRLPIDPASTLERLKKDPRVNWKRKTSEHAAKVSWRNVKMWVEAQLEFVKDGQVSLAQVMLPYRLVSEHQTMWDQFAESQLKLGGGNHAN